MPYITKEKREQIKIWPPGDPGELNYVLSMIIDQYLGRKGITYYNINEVIGVLECCKLEIYRRIAAPYENKKLEENGEVFTHII